jgi:hypothetical protein
MSLVRRSAVGCLLVVTSAICTTSRALAYDDLFRFNDPAAHGGGGGRWFTGSPADAYGCEVCHSGGAGSERVFVQGIPAAYALGISYDMFVAWSPTSQNVTAMLEFTDQLGHGAGEVAVAEVPLSAAESCVPVEDLVPAGIVLRGPELALPDGRQIVGMQDCGGNVLHWQWTAPLQDVGPVFFAGGIVSPDRQMDQAGDRVTRLARTIASATQVSYETRVASSCAVVRPGAAAASGWLLGLIGYWLALRRPRRR